MDMYLYQNVNRYCKMYIPCVCMDDFSKTDGNSQQCFLITMLFLRTI